MTDPSALQKLRASEHITEWLDPYDHRLEVATGDTAPNSGGGLREPWDVHPESEFLIAYEVTRLLVPTDTLLPIDIVRVEFVHSSDGRPTDPGRGTIVLRTPNTESYGQHLPIRDRTEVVSPRFGRLGWAGLALSQMIGLAVFTKQIDDQITETRVQRVPDAIFRAL